jgi:hypothetical protein
MLLMHIFLWGRHQGREDSQACGQLICVCLVYMYACSGGRLQLYTRCQCVLSACVHIVHGPCSCSICHAGSATTLLQHPSHQRTHACAHHGPLACTLPRLLFLLQALTTAAPITSVTHTYSICACCVLFLQAPTAHTLTTTPGSVPVVLFLQAPTASRCPASMT